MLDISLRQLEAFVATVEYCSFTRAAEELHLTQSTVSMHIRTLEEILQVRLIERGARRRFSLTEEGRKAYLSARDILSRAEAFQENRPETEWELLRIGTSTVPAQYLLPKLLSGFLRKHEDVKYILRRGDSDRVLSFLKQGEVRIGLVGRRSADRDFVFQEIAQDHLVLITANSESFRQKRDQGVSANELMRLPLIVREEGSGTQHAVDDFLHRLNLPDANVVARMDNPETIKISVSEGMGVSVISNLAVSEEVKAGKLIAFSFAGPDDRRKLYVAWLRDTLLTPMELKFIQHVKTRTSDILLSE